MPEFSYQTPFRQVRGIYPDRPSLTINPDDQDYRRLPAGPEDRLEYRPERFRLPVPGYGPFQPPFFSDDFRRRWELGGWPGPFFL